MAILLSRWEGVEMKKLLYFDEEGRQDSYIDIIFSMWREKWQYKKDQVAGIYYQMMTGHH